MATDRASTSFNAARCLVTGGTGFIARHLVAHLEAEGAEVWTTARRPTGRERTLWWPDLGEAPPEAPVSMDWVFHLAATTDLAACNRDPAFARRVNVVGTAQAVRLAGQAGAKLVYLSTLGVYGDPQYVPVDEDHPARPIEAYSMSKLEGERVVMEQAAAQAVPWVIVRSFNVYGPGQSEERLIPRLISQALGASVIRLKEDRSTRDFLFVEDLCRALSLAARRGRPTVYNAGTGVETSVAEVVRLLGRVLGAELRVELSEPARYPNVTRSQAGIARIQGELGWRAQMPLEEGLRRTVAWHRQLATAAAPG